ncbi:MAG: LysR family transcriptional regulator [Burkholderiaceae bacterium]
MLEASPSALRAFVLVASHRSFSKAARTLGTRQSTISSQISRLEELVGQPLFERSTRRVALSGAGKRLLPLAEEIVELHTVAAARVHDASLTGSVRIGAAESLWTSFPVAEVVGRFTRSHPEVNLLVCVDQDQAISAQFEADSFDICLLADPLVPGTGRLIRRERLRWYGRSPDAMHGQSTALVRTPYPSALQAIDQALEQRDSAGNPRYVITCEGTTLSAAGQAIAAGIGVGALPAGYADAIGVTAFSSDLPALPSISIYLLSRDSASEAAVSLRNQLLQRLGRTARAATEPVGNQRPAAAKRSR